MRAGRADDAHVELVWKVDIGRKATAPRNQRLVLEPQHGAADEISHLSCGRLFHEVMDEAQLRLNLPQTPGAAIRRSFSSNCGPSYRLSAAAGNRIRTAARL